MIYAVKKDDSGWRAVNDASECAADEYLSEQAPQVRSAATDPWLAHQLAAQAALDASDMVALRCFKAGVTFPAEWLTYVNALRAVVRASTGDPTQPLPSKPEYPAGT